MIDDDRPSIRAAATVLMCDDIDATVEFFVERLGFRVDFVMPADDPRVVEVSGHGARVRLERGSGAPGVLRLVCDGLGAQREWTAPNGTRIVLVDAQPSIDMPPVRPSFVLTRGGEDAWGVGRAGMEYRDLLPGRWGGRTIASHIRIQDGGPVPDYVHFHRVAFQMIFCRSGWVRVVYEDQGTPFVMRAGDCVLQPPEIRHRVLECSPGLEVIEISCPAEHATLADHELTLPTPERRPDRDFAGQRFVRHVAQNAEWRPRPTSGTDARDTGLAAATGGLASAHVVRSSGADHGQQSRHDAELMFVFVLSGDATLEREGHAAETLAAGDAFAMPPGMRHALIGRAADTEWLEVIVSA